MQSLATSFVRRGHEVVVVTTQPRGPAMLASIDGVSVYYLPVKNLYRPFGDFEPGPLGKSLWRVIDSFNVFMMRSMTRILRTEKPDIVNTHVISGLSVSLWSSVHRFKIPIVHTLHDQYLLCHRSTMFKAGQNCTRQCWDCRFLTIPRKAVSIHVATAVGVSQFILARHQALGYFNSAQSAVIYNRGDQHARLTPKPASLNPIRFGFLGQIIPTKGLKELIDALSAAQLPDAELHIGGKYDTPYAANLRAGTQALHNLRWLGYVNPEDFFRDIHVLVVPSVWNDTAPLVILEAFRHGVPVLGSKRGGIPELIPPHTGWLFDPEEPGALANALMVCAQSRENFQSMGQACLERVRQFELSTSSDDYLSAYRAAILQAETSKIGSI